MHSMVKDLMTTQVVTVGPDAVQGDRGPARRAPGERGAGGGRRRRVLGIVSEADLLLKEEFPEPVQDAPLFWTKRRRLERQKAGGATARDLMSSVVMVSTAPDATVAEAARRMHAAGVKRLPVIDKDGRLVGIVSRGDLLKVFNRPDQAIRREIIDDVIVGNFMMNPNRFFIHVDNGVVVLQGRVERHSLLPYVLRAVHDVEGVVRVENRLGYDIDDVDTFGRWPSGRSAQQAPRNATGAPAEWGPGSARADRSPAQVWSGGRSAGRLAEHRLDLSSTWVARSAKRPGRNGDRSPSGAWSATSLATSRPSTGARVTPLWLTARYSESSHGRGPTIGSRSAGMAR